MRGALGWVALALCMGAMAQERRTDLLLADAKVGDAVASLQPDGKWKSVARIKLGPTEIDSELTLGRDAKGKLVYVHVVEKSGAVSGDILFESGKLTVKRNGAVVVPSTARALPQAIFTPYHPLSWDTFVPAMKTGGKAKILDIQTLSEMDFSFTAAPTIIAGQSLNRAVTKIGALSIEFVHDGKSAIGMQIEAQKFKAVPTGRTDLFVDPLAKYPELSQPTHQVKSETVSFLTKDGTKLVADIVRPAGEGRFPVILSRTPYGRAAGAIMGTSFAKRGYVYISQDVRGTGESTGAWDPFNREREDGRETLDWIVAQSWAEPKVGMIGASYGGFVQWAAAVTNHPALKCIIPQVSPPEPTRNVPWDNGAWLLTGNIWWTRIVQTKDANLASFSQELSAQALNTMPLSKIDDKMLGSSVAFYDGWLRRDDASKWPGAFTTAQVGRTKIPALHISGTWDGDGVGTQLHWSARRAAGNSEQWMIFGPWDHLFNSKQEFGGVDFGPDSILELDSIYLRWFDHWLKERPVNLDAQSRVKFFITGANKWLETTEWPAPRAAKRTFHLGGSPRMNGALGNLRDIGPFAISGPRSAFKRPEPLKQDSVSFTYDPASITLKQNPKAGDGSTKATQKEITKDWLAFQTEPFAGDRVYAGTMEVNLLVSTSAKDATFFVVPLDRHPDGTFRAIAQPGKMRLAYRSGKRETVVPGRAYQIQANPWWFAHQFKKGHRLVLAVGCNTFPGFARNPGTGEPDFSATKMVKAKQTIYLKKSSVSVWETPIN